MIFYTETSFTHWYSETFYISKLKLFITSSLGNLVQQLSMNYLNNILGCEILSVRSSFPVMPTAGFYKLCNFTSPERKLQCNDVQHCSIYRCSFQPLYYHVTSAEDFSLDSCRSDFHWASCTAFKSVLLKLRLCWGRCFLHFYRWCRYSSRVTLKIWKLVVSLMRKPLIFPMSLIMKVCRKFFFI